MTLLGMSRAVLAAYRREWRILLLASFLVFGTLNALELALPDLNYDHLNAKRVLVALSLGAGSFAVSSFEEAFYEGVVASAAVEWRSGNRRPGLMSVARSVPYLVLTALNLVIALVTGLGLLFFVVPGVVLSTYIGLAPAAAKIEHLHTRAALRRSVELVRGHFWTIMVLLWGVYLVSEIATGVIDELLHGIVIEYVAKTTAEALLAPFYGLAAVLSAFTIIESRDRRPQPADAPDS